jgi:HSP20 family molecular chaperone IbpA
MQNNDPYDELFRQIARMMEDLLKQMSAGDMPSVIGYTLITGPGDHPRMIRITGGEERLPYELVEGQDRIFITAELPADLTTAPYVEIDPHQLVIHVEHRTTVIELPAVIDRKHTTYQIRHGILDIVCWKA